MGQIVENRLLQTATAQNDQSRHFSALVHRDVDLLCASVRTTITASHQTISGELPFDRRSSSWEARLRPVIRLLAALKEDDHQHRSIEVVQSAMLPLIEVLTELVTHLPPVSFGDNTAATLKRHTAQHSSLRIACLGSSANDGNDDDDQVSAKQHSDSPIHPTGGGENAGAPASPSSGTRQLTERFEQMASLCSELIPSVEFVSWLQERPEASFRVGWVVDEWFFG